MGAAKKRTVLTTTTGERRKANKTDQMADNESIFKGANSLSFHFMTMAPNALKQTLTTNRPQLMNQSLYTMN